MNDSIHPKDHAEAVALFRQSIVGGLVHRELNHGELSAELVALSRKRFRPPGASRTRHYCTSTLERWYYRLKNGGIEAARPARRSDRGHAQALSAEQRELLLAIREEHRSASSPLVIDTLVKLGRLDKDALTVSTLNRLYADHGLDRIAATGGKDPHTRLRWEAEAPDVLWHGDVCHGPALMVGGQSVPLRIHGLLDDASRYVVALAAFHTEREVDMLDLLVGAFRRHGLPGVLYLDNGSTYRGQTLETFCGRLGVQLLHARPYDPQARGKMERFWRTLRERCLRYLGACSSLHDVNARLLAFLDGDYLHRPHAGLMGRTPVEAYLGADIQKRRVAEPELAGALTTRSRHRVRRDTTLTVDGVVYELDQGFLAGRIVTVARCLLDGGPEPFVEHQDRSYTLRIVDPKANARRARPARNPDRPVRPAGPPVDFDPATARLDAVVGRTRNRKENK